MHRWEGGEYTFHRQICGGCEEDDDENIKLKCAAEEYYTTKMLSCPFHSLAYEIECEHLAEHSEDIIDPEQGKGHFNACEATFTVFPKVRPKYVVPHRLHCQMSMNLALLQSSMTYLFKKCGSE